MSTFIGCNASYEESKIVLFGAPFDGTTSYRPGTRFAGAAIRNESYSIETYSPYQDRDLTDIPVHDMGDLELCFGNTERVINQIYQNTKTILQDKKIPLMIGGEHLVSLGAVKAAYEQYPELHLLHFDAHSDCRDDYLNEKLSHATVIRRCWDFLGDGRIFQFGIRSGDREEFTWAKDHVFTQRFTLDGLGKTLAGLKGKPVYLTLDLDVLDPACFPGTGTPEAGGVGFNELLNALFLSFRLNIVGLDINELSPGYDPSGASTSLACKLLREILLGIDVE